MKTYAIALRRSKERYNYIQNHLKQTGLDYRIIDAIDGSKFTTQDLEANCDMNEVNKLRWWLTNGAIGCALSHYACYEAIVKSKDKAGFVVEDDAVLPSYIGSILNDIEKNIDENEVVLLYYTSFGECKLSNIGRVDLDYGSLVFPLDIKQTVTATAYVIGRNAAAGMLEAAKPISVCADSWHHFYNMGAFSSFRVLYPSVVKVTNFKSSLDYIRANSITGRVTQLINEYKLPIAYQILHYLRKQRLNRMLNNSSFTNESSPILNNILLSGAA
jgi:glycosyl transferase family 25